MKHLFSILMVAGMMSGSPSAQVESAASAGGAEQIVAAFEIYGSTGLQAKVESDLASAGLAAHVEDIAGESLANQIEGSPSGGSAGWAVIPLYDFGSGSLESYVATDFGSLSWLFLEFFK